MFAAKTLRIISVLTLALGVLFVGGRAQAALNQLPTPPPGSSSYGLEATKEQAPPASGATITIPGNGSSFSTSPINVGGICPADLLVEVYNNGVMAGSVMCKGGSFTLQVSLYSGQNELTAKVYDSLDQTGPDSNTVTVSYNPASFTSFASLITLTSTYGRRAANPGSTLTWPLQLSGGTGPYAFSMDWGDGKPSELKSQALPGIVNIDHVYKQAGIYNVTVRVTDSTGTSAFLQLVAIANGNAAATTADTTKKASTITRVVWLPAVLSLLLLFPAFWLGRRSELVSLRHKLERDAAAYKEL